ncbi:uncharacterized protein PV09_06950 [Verruconis gallopava]|uniref:Uncharacterized protein n=1 Tax=Verruconis gallopava TaxID=253628 RepID=A0A0D2A4R7_9PEZI|nr:uncharacterized protein PV09_06950 [Verruconis gallopava]KIW01778.1 hypothetical protein PV09_06950 [Verruconis gallopava]
MYAKADLVKHVKALYEYLDTIETARETWWQSKKELRAQLREDIARERQTQNFKAATQSERARQAQESAQERMNKLQAINARAMDMIENMLVAPYIAIVIRWLTGITRRNELDFVTQRTLQLSPVELRQ